MRTLALAALLLATACGKPLLFAEVEIPNASLKVPDQLFPSTVSPSPVDLCPDGPTIPGNTCLQQTIDFDLGKDFLDLVEHATKIDLHRPGVILDFKTKDFGPDDTSRLEAYDEHAMQLAAGTVAAGKESPRAAIVYVSRSHPGLSWPVGVSIDELTRGWAMFQSLLAYWKLKNRYDSSWE